MAATAMPSTTIALHGAQDSDIGSKDAKHTPTQAMYLEMPQDIVDELLDSARNGRAPQIVFGRTPVGFHCLVRVVTLSPFTSGPLVLRGM